MTDRTHPYSKEEIVSLEPFVGLCRDDIRVITNLQQAQTAFDELRQNHSVGFDTESKPTFHKGQESDGPHVLQFSTPQRAYIFRSHIAECHTVLRDLLESDAIVKVGFGLNDDISRIQKKFGINPRAIVDLSLSFKKNGYHNQVGVKSAIAIVFKKRLLKSRKLTTSNWSSAILSDKQILYAANDAHAAIIVYHALNPLGKSTQAGTARPTADLRKP
jgi:ribonuclease D